MLIDKRLDKVVNAINIRQVMMCDQILCTNEHIAWMSSKVFLDSLLCVAHADSTDISGRCYRAIQLPRWWCLFFTWQRQGENQFFQFFHKLSSSRSLILGIAMSSLCTAVKMKIRFLCTQWRKLVKIIRYSRYSYESYRNIRALFEVIVLSDSRADHHIVLLHECRLEAYWTHIDFV